MVGNCRYRDEDWLREQYIEHGKSSLDIGEMCDVNRSTVLTWLKKYDIETRDPSDYTHSKCPELQDEDWLREQYVENGHSTIAIGEMCDCAPETVLRWLNKHDIETRNPNDYIHFKYPELQDETWVREQINSGLTPQEIANKLDCGYEVVRRAMHQHDIPMPGNDGDDYRYRDEDWLREQYIENDYPMTKIADMCNCSSSTISLWVSKFDIDTGYSRDTEEYTELQDRGFLETRIEQGLSSVEIAEEVGCDPGTVRRHARRNNLQFDQTGSRFEIQYPELHDKAWLQKAIHDNDKSLRTIADELGCCVSWVSDMCSQHDIDVPMRGAGNCPPEKERGWTSSGNWVHAHDWLTYDQLYRAYWEYFWTQAEIAEWCGVGRRFVNEKLQEHDIERRTAFETRRAQQMFRPDKTMPNTTEYPDEYKERPHFYDDADMDAATVRRILGYGDESTDDNETDTDSRLTWTDLDTGVADD